MKNRFSIPLTLAILIALLLVGCGGQAAPTQEPTIDTNALRTEVAQTIEAAYTLSAAQTLAAEPTATEVIPTATEAATSTELPVVNTAMPVQPQATSTTAAPKTYPTVTPTYYPDRAELVSTSQVLGKSFKPGEDFDLVFTLKNIGDRNWTTSFRFEYLSGVKPSNHSGGTYEVVNLASAVATGKTTTLTLDMIAPSAPGHYTTTWSFVNDDATAFYTISYGFDVKNP